MQPPLNKSLQATRDGGSSSASRFMSFCPACLSLGRWAGDELATRDDQTTQLSILHAQTEAKRLYFGRVTGCHRHCWNPCGATSANAFQCQGKSTRHSVRQQFA